MNNYTDMNENVETNIDENVETNMNENVETNMNENVETNMNENVETNINYTDENIPPPIPSKKEILIDSFENYNNFDDEITNDDEVNEVLNISKNEYLNKKYETDLDSTLKLSYENYEEDIINESYNDFIINNNNKTKLRKENLKKILENIKRIKLFSNTNEILNFLELILEQYIDCYIDNCYLDEKEYNDIFRELKTLRLSTDDFLNINNIIFKK